MARICNAKPVSKVRLCYDVDAIDLMERGFDFIDDYIIITARSKDFRQCYIATYRDGKVLYELLSNPIRWNLIDEKFRMPTSKRKAKKLLKQMWKEQYENGYATS